MRMKKRFAAIMAVTLALSMPVTATAAIWEDVNDYDKLSQAFGDTEAEVHIILSGNISNDNGETLVSGSGQQYTIDGKDYTLTDIKLAGDGDVVINADITGSEDGIGLETSETVAVTVNGDIEAGYQALYAKEDSNVEVNGNISSEYDDAVNARDNAQVSVTGNIEAVEGVGIDTGDNAQVSVTGNIRGGAGYDGIDADDNSQVTVIGDVYGGSGNAPDADGNLDYGNMSDSDGYSDGGSGIEASESAKVSVDGSVYGGDAYGTYGYAGNGIIAEDNATVNVTGDVVGGNQIADPDVDADGTYGLAGDAIYMSNMPNITVGGDVIGGNASGQEAYAGRGVLIELTRSVEGNDDPTTAENEAEIITPGQLTVKGRIIGGESTGKDGLSSEAVFYGYAYSDENPFEDFVIPDEVIDQVVSDEDAEYIRYCLNQMPSMVYEAAEKYITHEERLKYQDEYIARIKELAAEYGVDTENITDYEDIVKAISDEQLEKFATDAMNIYNAIAHDLTAQTFAIPELTTSGMESGGDAAIVTYPEELLKYIESDYINYIEQEKDDEVEPDGGTNNEDDSKTDDSVIDNSSTDGSTDTKILQKYLLRRVIQV